MQTPCFLHLQNPCKSGPVNIVCVDRWQVVQLLDEALLLGEDAYTVDDQRLLWSFHWGCHDPCHLYSLEKLKLNRIEVYTFLSTKDVTLVGVKQILQTPVIAGVLVAGKYWHLTNSGSSLQLLYSPCSGVQSKQIVNGEGIEALLLDSCGGHLLSS